jgi:site-specific recombinase XerD
MRWGAISVIFFKETPMAIATSLDQHFVDTRLICPAGAKRHEFVDPQRTGLYIEVRAASPGQGTYYVRYKEDGKTRHAKLGRTTDLTLEDARKEAIAHKLTLKGPSPLSVIVTANLQQHAQPVRTGLPGEMLLDVFMTEHYFPHAKVHKRSVGRDEQLWRLRIKPKFGHLPLNGITRLAVQKFQYALAEEGLSKASVNHHIQLLRRILNLAVSWEFLGRNVLTRIPLFTLDNQVDRFLNEEQVASLVKVLKVDENRMVSMILMFLLATGARLNEALCARWSQVDADSGTWKIPATNSKSKRMKHLPLNSSALWVVGQLDTKGKSELLFPSPASGKPFTTITRQWYRIRKAAGIPDFFRIHDLRHTFASRMVSAGRSLFEVQKMLGHLDSRTSQRYSHLAMKSAQEASNAAAFEVA